MCRKPSDQDTETMQITPIAIVGRLGQAYAIPMGVRRAVSVPEHLADIYRISQKGHPREARLL